MKQQGFIPLSILIGALIITSLGSILFYQKNVLSELNKNFAKIKVSQVAIPTLNPAQPVINQNLNMWITYTNQNLGISIEYPPDWTANTACEKYGAIFFGYSSETAGKCDIYFNPRDLKNTKINMAFGTVVIEKKEGSFEEALSELQNDPKIKTSFPEAHETNIEGNRAIKVSVTLQNSDNPLFPNGTKTISYLINSPKNVVYHVGYYQQPSWQDNIGIFEQMVRTVKFL